MVCVCISCVLLRTTRVKREEGRERGIRTQTSTLLRCRACPRDSRTAAPLTIRGCPRRSRSTAQRESSLGAQS
uniref:Uncharacterized protein n=1 Tax=Hyaloperonospora arabidopsidis (strain Emoy2) TaxID=559515 RepID=M4B4D5_HYAAE